MSYIEKYINIFPNGANILFSTYFDEKLQTLVVKKKLPTVALYMTTYRLFVKWILGQWAARGSLISQAGTRLMVTDYDKCFQKIMALVRKHNTPLLTHR